MGIKILTDEEHQAALLRFAEYQAEQLAQSDNLTLLMMELALIKFNEKYPERYAVISAGVLSIYPAEKLQELRDELAKRIMQAATAEKAPS